MTELTHASFQDFIRANKFAAIHFWAIWNGTDAKMKDILEHQLPPGLRAHTAFAKLDTGPVEHHEMCRQHKIASLPCLELYRDGELIETVTGTRQLDEIVERLRRLASSNERPR
jgi:thioredoxin-like negative regulator of GroEL